MPEKELPHLILMFIKLQFILTQISAQLMTGTLKSPPEKITKDYIKDYTKVLELREQIENSQQIYLLFDTVDSLVLQLDRQIDLVMG